MAGHPSSFEEDADLEKRKKSSFTPNWRRDAKNGEHLWYRTHASGDLCSVEDTMCVDSGSRLKCSSCRMIVHSKCVPLLVEKLKLVCRSTFQDAEAGSYREKTAVNHHWISRRSQNGRCRTCGKSFGGKVSSLLNETVAMSCSWCKEVCHGRGSCFDVQRMEKESCDLGDHSNLIVPPTWILKLSHEESQNSQQVFALKPIPSSSSKPLLVFLNPKSGGNQGAKLLRSFQWLLNPRQVFDLSEGGPAMGLDLYRKVPNLRILVCGGDGSVGWILSMLDDLKVSPPPPLAVLPLGTGNDLARSLGWGGGYTDEPLSKVLTNIEEGDVIKLDRWSLKLIPNPETDMSILEDGRKNLPLNVLNNYFSLGVDALIALEFHEAREARPKKFTSRFRNKMFYGQAGGKDLIQRRWKDLCNFVTLECDGVDVTAKLKELKVHALLFLNISSYGGGTRPWGTAGMGQFQTPSTEDGLIEVIGLTTYQLPLLQAGGHGTPIAQCRRSKVTTSCTIPVQVDGEPCRLLPSVITIELLNTVNMIAKTKKRGCSINKENVEKIIFSVKQLTLEDYESQHHCKETLEEKATTLGSVSINFDTDLAEIRSQVKELLRETESEKTEDKDNCLKEPSDDQELQSPDLLKRMKTTDWWFLDSCSSGKYFRIDQAQEHLYYVNDICDQALYIAVQKEPVDDVTADAIKEAEPDDDDVSTNSSRQSQGSDDFRDIINVIKIIKKVNVEEIKNEVIGVESNKNEVNGVESGKNEVNGVESGKIDGNGVENNKNEADSDMDLLTAAKMGNLEQVAMLHANGHDLSERDHEGRTALHHAAFIGNTEIVRYLAAYAPITVLDAQDEIMYHTALHRAATRRDRMVCSILVTAGASLDLLDKQGYTAQELAAVVGDQILADYLESAKNAINL